MNFSEFCKIIDQPEKFGGAPNSYAQEHWDAWHTTVKGLSKLGSYFDKIMDHYRDE